MRDEYIVKPVYKALQVLQLLVETRRELSLSEVSVRLGLPKTTTYRYLYTLCDLGFAIHNPETDRYLVGAWGGGNLRRLQAAAQPAMRRLQAHFNETINLGVLDGQEIVYVHMLPAQRPLRMQARIGGRDPVYATALGKAILAHLTPERLTAALPLQLVGLTPNTITSLEQLHTELALTRQRGYAIDNGETEVGAICISAPIFDDSEQVVAALSVSAPANRLLPDQTAADEVRKAAAEISARLKRVSETSEHSS